MVADIGGTHARFAIAQIADGKLVSLGETVTLATDDYADLQSAWFAFAETIGRSLPNSAAMALAAPITNSSTKLTNNSWIIDPGTLNDELELDQHMLLNDFSAVAHTVDSVGTEHFSHLAGPEGALPESGVISVIGPGTGLGVAILVRQDGRNIVLPTEGGHLGFSPLDSFEDALFQRLRDQHGRVSVERIVSGPGLRMIYEQLSKIEGREVPAGDDRALWSYTLKSDGPLATLALEHFCKCLGSVSGDIVLSHGPGAVVIAGGLGLRLREVLPSSGFAKRFVEKGRYQTLMQSVPVKLLTHPEPGLFGAAIAFIEKYPEHTPTHNW